MKKQRETKYSKNIEWLKPFVDSVSDMVPLERLRSITGYKVKDGFEAQQWGALHTSNHLRFDMRLRVFNYDRPEGRNRPLSYEMILLTLAHELAHMVHWEHTPEHFELMSKIQIRFGRQFRKVKLTDHAERAYEVRLPRRR